MDTNSSSSSSASYSSSTQFPYQHHPQTKSSKRPPAFRSALHSARKSPAKSMMTKKPIAPLPPNPPRIYKVAPVEFKNIVQKLTGWQEIQTSSRLQEVSPPPLSLSPPHWPLEAGFVAEDGNENGRISLESSFGALSPLGFSLSPSSLAWCSTMLLSPGTLASLEPSAVL